MPDESEPQKLPKDPPEDDDWRLTGQEDYLAGADWIRKRYRVFSDTWEHDHCEFCWTKFMDPEFSLEHRKYVAENSEVLTEGYTTTADHSQGAEFYWVCPQCFDDFTARFGWHVVEKS
jgi:hypothetical protein